MSDTLLHSTRMRLREARMALDQAQRLERRLRARIEHGVKREDLDAFAAAVRSSAEAACDCAALVLAVVALERLSSEARS